MKPWQTRIWVIVMVAMSLALRGRLGAQESPPASPSFAEICREAEAGSAARYTVELLLERARTEDCQTAQERLQDRDRLAFSHKGDLTDLTPLAGLPHLEELNITRTGVSDLAPLAQLPNLNWLTMHVTPVSDFTPLAQVLSLEVLLSSYTQVSDLAPLAALPHLYMLEISGNPVHDLTPLAGLTQLSRLSIEGHAGE